MSKELLEKLRATEHGQWSHWLWEFLYNWQSECETCIKENAFGLGVGRKQENGKRGCDELRKLYNLAEFLEAQAFRSIERDIPWDTRKLIEIGMKAKKGESQ